MTATRSEPSATAKTHYRGTPVLILAIVLAGGLGTWWTVRRIDGQKREDLVAQARRTAQGLNLVRVASFRGTEADRDLPSYRRLKDALALAGQANGQIRGMCLLGCRADASVFVFADSEPSASDGASQSGRPYEGPTETVRRVFTTDRAVVAGPETDSRGRWMRAYVPVSDPWSDSVLAVFRLDVDAGAWNRDLAGAALLPGLLTLLWMAISLAAVTLLARRLALTDAPRWMRHIEAGWVVAAGLILSCFAARTACTHEAHARESMFAQLADSETERVAKVLRDLNDFELKGLAKYCEHEETVTASDFRNYAEALTANRAVQAWEWIPAVAASERAEFEREAAANGLDGFQFWEQDSAGRRVPAAPRAMYYPILHVVPQAANEAAIGYDAGSEPVRQTSLEEAVRTGLGVATAPITLVQETENQKGMVIFRAAFSPEQKRLKGFAVAVLRMGTLLESVQETSAVHLELALLDRQIPPELLSTHGEASWARESALAVSRPVAVFGRVFQVSACPGADFLSRLPVRAGWLTALTGTVLTALLAAVVGVSLRRREELTGLVASLDSHGPEWT